LYKLPDLDESNLTIPWGMEEKGGPGVYKIHNEEGETLATHTATNITLPFPNNMKFDTTKCWIENAWSQRAASFLKPNPLFPFTSCHALANRAPFA